MALHSIKEVTDMIKDSRMKRLFRNTSVDPEGKQSVLVRGRPEENIKNQKQRIRPAGCKYGCSKHKWGWEPGKTGSVPPGTSLPECLCGSIPTTPALSPSITAFLTLALQVLCL